MDGCGLSRRELLKLGGIVGAGVVAGLGAPGRIAAGGDRWPGVNEYAAFDGLGLAELVRRGETSPLDLLEVAIERLEEVNPRINAVVLKHYDHARKRIEGGLPDGPFKGVPFLLKDLQMQLRGTVTTNGSRFFRDRVATSSSTLVTRYEQAGLVIFGKTASPEFGGSPSSESALFGATRNPWNLEHSAGGSSGGSAAAIAAGIVPMANASDGGGSIRIPASCCGLFGMKPTRGRVPLGPGRTESRNGLSVVHAITRSVRDSAALLDATRGPERGAPYRAPSVARPYLEEVTAPPGKLRIALMREPITRTPVHPECLRAVDDAAKLCESLGHSVAVAAPVLPVEALYRGFGISSSVLTSVTVAAREKELGRPATREDLEPLTWQRREEGSRALAVDYARARAAFDRSTQILAEFQQEYDLILSPTLSTPPEKIGVLSLSQEASIFNQAATLASAFTMLFNATGQPAMSVPLHWSESGLPVGVMFAGRFGDEATLYRLAAQLEEARPWVRRGILL
jgi:Asp-tRNA(Asn)/Glu-tRNA(Gln) amidotransferase A subunit family amidase